MKQTHRTNLIRKFILDNVTREPRKIARLTSGEFGISRQAANRHLQKLVTEGFIEATGSTTGKEYTLKVLAETRFQLSIEPNLEEDAVWRARILPHFTGISSNVRALCQYGFTEILNNAIDHSEGVNVVISVKRTSRKIELQVLDDGVGIFHKIQSVLGLEDHRHAILELAKGKLTTDPERHTGEGIFFTTRMFDDFSLLSGQLFFRHYSVGDDWLVETAEEEQKGTAVKMLIDPNSTRTTKEVFDKYSIEAHELGFTRTHVPVTLARYGDENLVSRSQAKRLLARFNRFREILLDFADVETIGQAFADEIFRVFQRQNPHVHLIWIRANEEVKKMIQRVREEPELDRVR